MVFDKHTGCKTRNEITFSNLFECDTDSGMAADHFARLNSGDENLCGRPVECVTCCFMMSAKFVVETRSIASLQKYLVSERRQRVMEPEKTRYGESHLRGIKDNLELTPVNG